MKRKFTKYPSKVEACDTVTASYSPLKLFKILDLSTKTVSDMNAESSRRALERFLECDVIPVSTIEEADYAVYPDNQPEMDRYYKASSQSITSLMSPYADALTSIGYDGKKFLNEVSSEYTYDELSDADDLHACICGFILNSDYINQEDASKLADNVINQVGNINACDTKYFANMVSASNDPELDDDFLIEGYYDNQRRGLAESAETSDVSALNELANEYANKGYYIVVHNLTDGTITEFSADNWFNDIAPDGGAGLFMSW